MLQLFSAPPRIKRKRRKPLPANTLRVYFQDEAPHIGAGWRLIELVSLGHKWAKLRDVSTDTRARLPRAVWIAISKRAKAVQ